MTKSKSLTKPLHPESGYHYIFVIPATWGSYVDYHASYAILEKQLPWVSLIDAHTFSDVLETVKNDDTIFFVLWDTLPAPRPHKCVVTTIYFEAVDDNQNNMLPEHVVHWQRVGQVAPDYDAVLAHTPRMVAALGRGMNLPAFLFPAGWSPEAMGMPREKHVQHQLTYWGSFAGRRIELIPFLKRQLGSSFVDASGCFGRTLLGTLELSKAALYVAHSNVWSFSTWRLWQGIAAGTPHIAEPGDSWPFVAGKHYIPFSPFDVTNEKHNIETARLIANICKEDVWLQNITDAAYDELAERFTIRRCVEDYLVPASIQLKTLRNSE